eukprot:NODE_23_length_38171_cov_0.318108.p10 type:complete len:393 gc:universal NODE_23_length_38171_cov_0.318108:13648-12470(-)
MSLSNFNVSLRNKGMGDIFKATSLLDPQEDEIESLISLPISKSPSSVHINSSATQQRVAYAKEFIEDKYNYIQELHNNSKTYNPLHAARHFKEFKKQGTLYTGNKIHKYDVRVVDMRRCELLEDIRCISPMMESISDILVKSESHSTAEKDPRDYLMPQKSETSPSIYSSNSSLNYSNLLKYKLALPNMTFVTSEMHLIVKELENQTNSLNDEILERIQECKLLIESCNKVNDVNTDSGSLKSPFQSMNLYQDVSSESVAIESPNKWYNSINEIDMDDMKSSTFSQQLSFWKFQLNEVHSFAIQQTDETNSLAEDVVYFRDSIDNLAVVIYDLYGAMINQLEYLFQYAINYSSSEPLTDVVLSFVEFFIPVLGFTVQITYTVIKWFKVKVNK